MRGVYNGQPENDLRKSKEEADFKMRNTFTGWDSIKSNIEKSGPLTRL